MKTYHNTTNTIEPTLSKYEKKCANQQETILEHFKRCKVPMTPYEVWSEIYMGKGVPLTSVRRAISNLTRDGKLEKTDRQVEGPYGHPEYLWRLPGGQQRLF